MIKLYKLRKKNKGFTLVECVIAIAIFAIMMAIVSGILSISIRQYGHNDKLEKDVDGQIQNLADNSNVAVNSAPDISMEFEKGDGLNAGVSAPTINIDNVKIKNESGSESNFDRLEIDQIFANIKPEPPADDEGKSPSMADGQHVYGVKGLKSVEVSETLATSGDNTIVTLGVKIVDEDLVLNKTGTALKVVLPKETLAIKISNLHTNIKYVILTNGTIRFDKIDKSFTEKDFGVTIEFTIPTKDFETEYVNFGAYFLKDESSTVHSATLLENPDAPGIYNVKS